MSTSKEQDFFQYVEDRGLRTYDSLVIQNASDISRESDRIRTQKNWSKKKRQQEALKRMGEDVARATEGGYSGRHFRLGCMTMPAPQDRLPPSPSHGFTVRSQSLHSVGGGSDDGGPNSRKQPPPKPKRDPTTKLSSSAEAVDGSVPEGLRLAVDGSVPEGLRLAVDGSVPEGLRLPQELKDSQMEGFKGRMPPPKPKRNPDTQLSASFDESYIFRSQNSSLRRRRDKSWSQGRSPDDGEEPVYIEMVGNALDESSRGGRQETTSEEEPSEESVYEEMKFPATAYDDFLPSDPPLPLPPPPFPNLHTPRPPLLTFPPAPAQCSPNSDESPLTPIDVTKLPVMENVVREKDGKDAVAAAPPTNNATITASSGRSSAPPTNATVTASSGRSSAPPTNATVTASSGRSSAPPTNATVTASSGRSSAPPTNATITASSGRSSAPPLSSSQTITASGRSSAPPLPSNLYSSTKSSSGSSTHTHTHSGRARSQSACPSPVSMGGGALTPLSLKRPPPYDVLMAGCAQKAHAGGHGTKNSNSSSSSSSSGRSRTPTASLDSYGTATTVTTASCGTATVVPLDEISSLRKKRGFRAESGLNSGCEEWEVPSPSSAPTNMSYNSAPCRNGRSSVSPTRLGGENKTGYKLGRSASTSGVPSPQRQHFHTHPALTQMSWACGDATMLQMIEKKRVLCKEIKDKSLVKQDSMPSLPSWKSKRPPPYGGQTVCWDTAI